MIILTISLLFSSCVTGERLSGKATAEANGESHKVGGEVHYKLLKW